MGSRVNARIVVTGIALLMALAAVALAVKGPADAAHAQVGTPGGLQATIRTTSHGIPHIVASDFPGLGFGTATRPRRRTSASSRTLRDRQRGALALVRARRVLSQGGNGTTNNNLNSDFFFQKIKDNGSIEHLLALDPRAARGPRSRPRCAVTWRATTST